MDICNIHVNMQRRSALNGTPLHTALEKREHSACFMDSYIYGKKTGYSNKYG